MAEKESRAGSNQDSEFKLEVNSGYDLRRWVLLKILTSLNWRSDFSLEYHFDFDENIFDDDSVTRQITIFEQRAAGKTLDEIGKSFGITRERIRQILESGFSEIKSDSVFRGKSCSEVFLEKAHLNKQLEINRVKDEKAFIDSKVREILNFNPGLKAEEISEYISIDSDLLISSIDLYTSKFIWAESNKAKQSRFSDEIIFEALRHAENEESPLSQSTYKKLIDKKLIRGPGPQTVAIRFGTWSHACELAGVSCLDPVLESYARTWNTEDFLQIFIEFLKHPSFGSDVNSYNQWRSSFAPQAPSSAHLRNNFDGWNNVKNHTFMYMRRQEISCGFEIG